VKYAAGRWPKHGQHANMPHMSVVSYTPTQKGEISRKKKKKNKK
jgi:hypothetical protein